MNSTVAVILLASMLARGASDQEAGPGAARLLPLGKSELQSLFKAPVQIREIIDNKKDEMHVEIFEPSRRWTRIGDRVPLFGKYRIAKHKMCVAGRRPSCFALAQDGNGNFYYAAGLGDGLRRWVKVSLSRPVGVGVLPAGRSPADGF